MQKLTLYLAMLLPVTVAAQADSTAIQEVVVTGTRLASDARRLPATVTVIDREALLQREQPNVLPTLSELVPGLFVTSRGMMGYGVSTGAAGGITMRGLGGSSGQMMVLIDGHPQFSGVYGHTISDSYQVMMAERIEVLRGPASVLYGSNAMGGVINIVTREPQTDRVATDISVGMGSWGTVQADVSNQIRRKRFSSTIAAQYGRSDNHRPDMEFEQFGGYIKLDYRLSPNWQARADADVTHWNASNPGSTSAPLIDNDQYITRGTASAAITNRYRHTAGELSLYYNWGRHKINDGHAEGAKPQTELFRSRDAVAGCNAWQSIDFCSGSRLTVGLDYLHLYGHAWYTSIADGSIVTTGRRAMQSANRDMDEVGAYADMTHDIGRCLTLNAGVRYDHHTVAGGEWVPQAGLAYRPMRDGELKATFGKGFRNPSLKEMYLYGTRNDQLRPERLLNYELAWHHKLKDNRLTYSVNLFYMKGSNIIMAVAGKNTNSGKVENWGSELQASWHANSHLDINTNHSIMHMATPLAYTPQYKAHLGATCHYDRWKAGIGVQQLCGLYTIQDNAYANGTRHHITLLDATIGYNATRHITVWVKGDNLLAQRYSYIEGYPMPRATTMAGVRAHF